MSTRWNVKQGMPLSGREVEVVAAVASGRSNRQVGKLLGISVSTVKDHLERVSLKLGVRGREAIVRVAVRSGQVSRPARPVSRARVVSERELAIRRVLLEWADGSGARATVRQVELAAREVELAVGRFVPHGPQVVGVGKAGATADDARRIAARLEASFKGAQW